MPSTDRFPMTQAGAFAPESLRHEQHNDDQKFHTLLLLFRRQ